VLVVALVLVFESVLFAQLQAAGLGIHGKLIGCLSDELVGA